MDLGRPLDEYGTVDITDLRAKVQEQSLEFWECDRVNRVNLAGNRPGNAVFFYNDNPEYLNRNTRRETQSGVIHVLRYSDRPLFKEIQALIEKDIMPSFPECDIVRVQLAELPPGEVIAPHRDLGILRLIHRLHVPLITHQGVEFIISWESFFLEEGKLYDLNNAVMHSVENNSDVMRIHLLVDMLPHDVARACYHDDEQSMATAVDETWGVEASA